MIKTIDKTKFPFDVLNKFELALELQDFNRSFHFEVRFHKIV